MERATNEEAGEGGSGHSAFFVGSSFNHIGSFFSSSESGRQRTEKVFESKVILIFYNATSNLSYSFVFIDLDKKSLVHCFNSPRFVPSNMGNDSKCKSLCPFSLKIRP